MSFNPRFHLFIATAMVLLLFAAELDAQGRGGRGGGRGFSRSGVASRGSLAPRPRGGYSPQRRNLSVQRPQRNAAQRRQMQIQRPNPRIQGPSQRFDAQVQDRRQRLDRQVKSRDQRRERVSGGNSKQRNLEDRQEWRDKNREDWQKELKDRQEDRQDFIKDRQEDRQDFVDDRWGDHDYHHGGHHHDDWDSGDFAAGLIVGGVVVGGAAAIMQGADSQSTTHVYHETHYVATLPCNPAMHTIQGVTYYRCGSDWFQRSFTGSQVTYIAVPPPPGY